MGTGPNLGVVAGAEPFSRLQTLFTTGDPALMRSAAETIGAFSVRVIVALLILSVTLWAAKRLGSLVHDAIVRASRHRPADTTLADFVGALVRYGVIAIGLIAVLQQLGVQATSVIAVLGAASLAVGLALQGALGNVAAGVMILVLRPYRVGEQVELNGRVGRVSGLDLFNTCLTDYDGVTIYLPNGKVFGDMIINYSHSGTRRVELNFGVDYEDDLDLALRLLVELAAEDSRVLTDPAPWAKVTTLADSSVIVTLRCWTTPEAWLETKVDLTKTVKERFEAEGLSFPFPQRTISRRKG